MRARIAGAALAVVLALPGCGTPVRLRTVAPAAVVELEPRPPPHPSAPVPTSAPPALASPQRPVRRPQSHAGPLMPPHAPGTSLGTFTATCYALRGRTASGAPAGPGRIAVDPRAIRMGTRLWVSGYGYAVAADTGGAVKGRRVDVWLSSPAACRAWGVRRVEVRLA